MMHVANRIQRFLTSDDGPAAVEYAVMLLLIVVACLVAINSVGTNTKTSFINSANSIASAKPKLVVLP